MAFFPQPLMEVRLAWMNLLLDREEAFVHRVERAQRRGAETSVLHSLRARHHVKHRDWPRAIQEYEQAVLANPGKLQPHLGLGSLLAGLGDLEGARSAFERGIRHLPQEADLYYNAGLSLALSGDAAGAIRRFGRGAG